MGCISCTFLKEILVIGRRLLNNLLWHPGTLVPDSQGYVAGVEGRRVGKHKYIVARHVGHTRNPVVIFVLKRPIDWTDAGKDEVTSNLTTYIEEQFHLTRYTTIYALGGIGPHWAVWKMEKSDHILQSIHGWQDDISSDSSFAQFERIVKLVHHIQ
ncbi:hypothetical protein DXG03_004626 [Asterophora parasitica]|uniref:Uncharacterized protein n=1 Tax=Asterophora parasitica TaxID=117018 RepID=A0A9P7GAL4_9AGAR|nr:hypothetical protein DXG03_004626 [Asterophora parasitica]